MSQPEIIDFYNTNAKKFYEERVLSGGSLYNEFIEIPAVLKLLNEDLADKSILDVGCGLGLYSKYLSEKGGKVTAIDSSEEMIKYAKCVCSSSDINFVLDSFQNYFPQSIKDFDIILGSFMLSYFNDLDALFLKVSRLLSPNGFCVMSMLHPLRLSSKRDKNGVYSIENYFDSNSYYQSDFLNGNDVLYLKKWTVSDIAHAACNAGLAINLIVEPKPKNVPAKFKSQKTEYLKRCPSVIIFKLVHNKI